MSRARRLESSPVTCPAQLLQTVEQEVLLRAYAQAWGATLREIYIRVVVGKEPWFVKGGDCVRRELIGRGWLQREATSIYKTALAAQESMIEHTKLLLEQWQDELSEVEEGLKNSPKHQRHGRSRRRDRIKSRIDAKQAEMDTNALRVCFGSRRRLAATRGWDLDPERRVRETGYAKQNEARIAWQRSRDGQIYCEGDRQAVAGNASLRVLLDVDSKSGEIYDAVAMRIPCFLRHLCNGQEWVAIRAQGFPDKQGREYLRQAQARTKLLFKRRDGQGSYERIVAQEAVSARIYWCEKKKRWYVSATVSRKPGRGFIDQPTGVLGIDVNCDELSWVALSSEGNKLGQGRIALDLAGSANQNRNAIGCAVGELLRQAQTWEERLGGPLLIAHETLDFRRARQGLRYLPPRLSRLLSSFSYNQILQTLVNRAAEQGFRAVGVNPAWTSVLGQANYASCYGISVDQGAAVVIARRALGLRTRLRPSVADAVAARSRARGSVSGQASLKKAAQLLPKRKATYDESSLSARKIGAVSQGSPRPEASRLPAARPAEAGQAVVSGVHRAPARPQPLRAVPGVAFG